MVTHRTYWLDRIEAAWRSRSIVWLAGVRRSGKTCLSKTLPNTDYFDCELPRVRRRIEDPQDFLDSLGKGRFVLDEIHRLKAPSELLKIAADHYPDINILATGSSTLGASSKFKDTLAGRKYNIHLTPMISEDLIDFQNTNLSHRLFRGGLPPFFLPDKVPERDFQEWMDAFWSKDIQLLFRLERRDSLQRFTELLMAQSGGIFEATRFAQPCEVSRTTIKNYLKVLEATFVINVVRPYSTHLSTEIVSAPKVYGFDTGFICYYRGWNKLRKEDLGILWEHYILNEIQAHAGTRYIHYWRNKRGHEVDFIYIKRGSPPLAIECKWSANQFELSGLKAFRHKYPEGDNLVIAQDIDRSYTKTYAGIKIKFMNISGLLKKIRGISNGRYL